MNFARVWTGFHKSPMRPNFEQRWDGNENLNDPMKVSERDRDPLPKTDLVGGHIGDMVPVCADLPDKMFLKTGAKYVYKGWSPIYSTPCWNSRRGCTGRENTYMYPGGQDAGSPGHTNVAATSGLYPLLCQPDSAGVCQFPSEVVLTDNLDCDGAECSVNVIRSVRIVTAVETVYYQYIPAPCVDLAFYNGGKQLEINGNGNPKMCANPLTDSGTTVCCNTPMTHMHGLGFCEFHREKTSFAVAEQKCTSEMDAPVVDGPNWQNEYGPLPATSNYFIAKDRLGAGTAPICAAETEGYAVRCCSDTATDGFIQPAGMATAAEGANVALGRPTTQSSTHGGNAASRAVDGNPSSLMGDSTCTHTGRRAQGTDEWWQVDLGSSLPIQAVNILNRGDCCTGRTNGAGVWVSDTPDYTTGTQCATLNGGQQINRACAATGRYVTIAKNYMFLHFCEVEVVAAHTEVCSAAFPAGMPWSTAALNNSVTQAIAAPSIPEFSFVEGPCGGGAYSPIRTIEQCTAAMGFLGIGHYGVLGGGSAAGWTDPGGHWIEGCFHRNTQVCFHPTGATTSTGWGNNFAANHRSICVRNDDPSPLGCQYGRTQAEAVGICAAEGARLCTAAEITAECVNGNNCDSTSGMVWTAETCEPPADMKMVVCHESTWEPVHPDPRTCDNSKDWSWIDADCHLQVQTDQDGYVSLVHASDASGFGNSGPAASGLYSTDGDNNGPSRFNVRWQDGLWPDVSANCTNSPDCTLHTSTHASADMTCLCDTAVVDTAVFTDDANLPSTAEVLASLHIGAGAPDAFPAGTYERCTTAACTAVDVQVWTLINSSGSLDLGTVRVSTLYGAAVSAATLHCIMLSHVDSICRYSGWSPSSGRSGFKTGSRWSTSRGSVSATRLPSPSLRARLSNLVMLNAFYSARVEQCILKAF